MGYMGFGMRKEVYQRKPKKLSVDNRYKGSKSEFKVDIDKVKNQSFRIRREVPSGLKFLRFFLYKLVPLGVLLFIIYSIIF